MLLALVLDQEEPMWWLTTLAAVAVAGPCERAICEVSWGTADNPLRPVGKRTALEVGLGSGDIGPSTVRVRLDTDGDRLVQVRVRKLTSLTVMNEGPHVDLMDWDQHGATPWVRAPMRDGVFDVRAPLAGLTPGPFPDVEPGQIAAGTRAQLERFERAIPEEDLARWSDHAATCADAHTYPCAVEPSHVELEIEVWEGARVVDRHTVVWVRPLGC